jgi:hypothetical protein
MLLSTRAVFLLCFYLILSVLSAPVSAFMRPPLSAPYFLQRAWYKIQQKPKVRY